MDSALKVELILLTKSNTALFALFLSSAFMATEAEHDDRTGIDGINLFEHSVISVTLHSVLSLVHCYTISLSLYLFGSIAIATICLNLLVSDPFLSKRTEIQSIPHGPL